MSTTNPELEELPPDPVLEGHSDDDELPPGPEKPLRWRDPYGSDAEFSDGDEAGWDSDSDASDEETNWRAEVVAEANRSTVCSLSDEEDTLETAVAASLDKMAAKRTLVAKEILSTEQSYVAGLDLVQDLFLPALRATNKPLVPQKVMEAIFLNSKELRNLHRGILSELELVIADTTNEPAMGAFFCKVAPYLHIYAEYTTHFEKGANKLGEVQTKIAAFAEVLKACYQDSRVGLGLTLGGFLLEPVQRIPRYKLLLQEYQKKIPEGHPDEADTVKALQLIKDVATSVNEHIRDRETLEQLEELQEKFPPSFKIVKEGRKQLQMDTLMKMCRRGPQERVFFLFSDCLVYCGQSPTTNRYINPKELPLSSMKAAEIDGAVIGQSHCIELSNQKKSFILGCSSLGQKLTWLNAIQEAIHAYKKRRKQSISFDSAAALSETGFGEQAPMWIPDKGVSMCQLCTVEFSMVRRRHHCRLCGRVICGPCSANSVPIAYLGNKSERVCDNCFRTVQAKDGVGNVTSKRQKQIEKTVSTKRGILHSAANGMKGSKDTIFSGFLLRKTGLLGSKKKSWYVLKRDFVVYSYAAPEDIVATETLPMPGRVVKADGKGSATVFTIAMPTGGSKTQKMVLEADSAESTKRWIECLDKASRAEAAEAADDDDDDDYDPDPVSEEEEGEFSEGDSEGD